MNTTPRVRRDLTATPSQEGEIAYIDVHDPQSGGSLRLYEHEWLIAQQMDGRRTFAEVASWARSQFEWQPSPEDLQAYAEKLRELGFLATDGAGAEEAAHEEAVAATRDVHRRATVPEFEAPGEAAPPPPAERKSSKEMPAVPGAESHRPPPPHAPAPRATAPEAPPAAARPAPPSGMPPSAPPQGMAPPARPDPTPSAMREPPSLPPPEMPAPRRDVPAARATTAMTVPPSSPSAEMAAAQKPKSGSGGKILLVVILLAALGGGGFWAYQTFAPGVQAVPVSTIKAPAATTVARYYAGTSKVQGSAAISVSFEQAGKVASAVEAGAMVKAGDPVVTLEGYAQLAKTLTDVKDREKYYLSKNDPIKVAEKRRIIADLEKKIAPLQLLAPAAATVTEVAVKVGDAVKPGDVAIKLANPSLFVEFQLPAAEVATLAQDKMVRLEAVAGGAAEDGKVVALPEGKTDGKVKIELGNSAGSLKQGDEVRIVKAKLSNVIAIPLAAVRKSAAGAEQIFVSEQGVAHARPIVIAERDDTNALVSSGVSAGDEVVTDAPATLQEGQKVTTGPAAK